MDTLSRIFDLPAKNRNNMHTLEYKVKTQSLNLIYGRNITYLNLKRWMGTKIQQKYFIKLILMYGELSYFKYQMRPFYFFASWSTGHKRVAVHNNPALFDSFKGSAFEGLLLSILFFHFAKSDRDPVEFWEEIPKPSWYRLKPCNK